MLKIAKFFWATFSRARCQNAWRPRRRGRQRRTNADLRWTAQKMKQKLHGGSDLTSRESTPQLDCK